MQLNFWVVSSVKLWLLGDIHTGSMLMKSFSWFPELYSSRCSCFPCLALAWPSLCLHTARNCTLVLGGSNGQIMGLERLLLQAASSLSQVGRITFLLNRQGAVLQPKAAEGGVLLVAERPTRPLDSTGVWTMFVWGKLLHTSSVSFTLPCSNDSGDELIEA